jgi:hypothetical protein
MATEMMAILVKTLLDSSIYILLLAGRSRLRVN